MASSTNDGLGKHDTSDRYNRYRIIRALAPAAKAMQGRSYLVEDTADGETKVMKTQECNDEYEVEKVVHELVALLNLQHKYISQPVDIFTHFDAADESCYVCVVSQFFDQGTLAFVMEQYRSKEGALPEAIVKKWLGQLVEALKYLHLDMKIAHHAIKPTNVYLTDSMDVVLGDFGASMVMHDVRERPRTARECRTWLPPDNEDQPFGFMADIYSLGCVFLDVGSTAYADEAMCTSNREELRRTPEILPGLLKKVAGSFSSDLCNMLRLFLNVDLRVRPDVEAILGYSYIKNCLKLCKSEIIAAENKRLALAVAVKPTTTKRIPHNVSEIFDYLTSHMERVGVVVVALENLCYLITGNATKKQESITMGNRECSTLKKAMDMHAENRFVQIASMNLLRLVAGAMKTEQLMMFVDPTIDALKTHIMMEDLLVTACQLVGALCDHEECVMELANRNCANILLEVWRLNIESPKVIESCLIAMCGQTVMVESMKFLVAGGCQKDAIEVLDRYEEHPGIVANTCTLIWGLLCDDSVLEYYVEKGLTLRLMDIVSCFQDDITVLQQLAMALSSLVVDERCATQVTIPIDRNPVQAIVSVLSKNHSESAFVEAMCSLIKEMCHHFCLIELLLPCELVELLTRLADEHRYRPSIREPCKEALNMMSNGVSTVATEETQS